MNNDKEIYKYCTYWYPTIFHRDLTVIPGMCENEDQVIISEREVHDCSGSIHLVSIALGKKDENLTITSKPKNSKNEDGEFTITLEKRGRSNRNGLRQYRYKPSDIKGDKIKFEDMLERAIYHIAKEFYHSHEVNSETDSALRGRITDYEVDISEDDNEHLIGFLKNYAKIFVSYARIVSYTNTQICETENILTNLEEAISKDNTTGKAEKQNDRARVVILLKRLLIEINTTNKYCENALIEYTYYNTFLNSRYNKSFHHRPLVDEYMCRTSKPASDSKDPQAETFRNDCRMKAINVENSISFIRNIQSKNQSRLHNVSNLFIDQINKTSRDVNSILSNIHVILDESEYTGKQSKSLSFFGLLIGFVFGVSELISIKNISICMGLSNIVVPKSSLTGGIILFISVCFLIRLIYLHCKYKKRKRQTIAISV